MRYQAEVLKVARGEVRPRRSSNKTYVVAALENRALG